MIRLSLGSLLFIGLLGAPALAANPVVTMRNDVTKHFSREALYRFDKTVERSHTAGGTLTKTSNGLVARATRGGANWWFGQSSVSQTGRTFSSSATVATPERGHVRSGTDTFRETALLGKLHIERRTNVSLTFPQHGASGPRGIDVTLNQKTLTWGGQPILGLGRADSRKALRQRYPGFAIP